VGAGVVRHHTKNLGMSATAMLKYHGSIDHGMGRCDLIADGSTTADLAAGESADGDGAINGMKSLYVGSVPSMRFGGWAPEKR